MLRRFPGFLLALLFILGSPFATSAGDSPGVPARYSGCFDPADLPAPETLSRLESDINGYFDTRPDEPGRRVELEKKISASVREARIPFRVVEAVVRRGRTWPPAPSGTFLRTWIPSVGGVERSYALFVPASYDPERPTPLLVSLHGTNGDGPTYLPVNRDECERRGWICVAPSAEGNTGFAMSRAGMACALDLPGLVAREYHVDPDRIYLEGMSMGAHSAWYLGALFPDRWAALLSRSGAPWLVPNFLDNFSNLPSYSINGAADPLVRAALARQGRDGLASLGCICVYRELPGRGHELFQDENPAAFEWLTARHRDPYPRAIVLKAEELRFARTYWCRILEWRTKQPVRSHFRGRDRTILETREGNRVPGKVTARVEDGRIELDTENVAQLRIFLDDALVDLDRPVVITAGGKTLLERNVARSVARLLREAYDRGDRSMTFANWVDLKIPSKP